MREKDRGYAPCIGPENARQGGIQDRRIANLVRVNLPLRGQECTSGYRAKLSNAPTSANPITVISVCMGSRMVLPTHGLGGLQVGVVIRSRWFGGEAMDQATQPSISGVMVRLL